MDKYNYSNLQKLNKDELIYIMSMIEKDIREEYEVFTMPPVEMYHTIKKLFEDGNRNLNPLPHEQVLNNLITHNIDSMILNAVTLKFEIINGEISKYINQFEGDNYWVKENDWFKTISSWDFNILDNVNVKEVICINGSGVNQDKRSGPCNVRDEDLRCKMLVKNNKITLKNLIEIIYRVKGSKCDTWYELFSDILTHINEKGTLFIEVDFNHGS